jgi:hypothetical protein
MDIAPDIWTLGWKAAHEPGQADMLYKQESLCALHVVTYQSSLLRQIF